MRTIYCADLFCGGGGTSTGLVKAATELMLKIDLLAINHWGIAVETHKANYPWAKHLCASLDNIDPRKVVTSGRLDGLAASPECTHHANARGGKPCSDQSRASAWQVLHWAELLQIDWIMIENVREFTTWGPLGANGKPLKSKRGLTFCAFINALRSLGYTVEWRVLNAADYGDPTSRERLFIVAFKGRKPFQWPTPSHGRDDVRKVFTERQPWKAAREVIDWSIEGQSIFRRKKPLCPNTLERIKSGLKRFGGEPFLAVLNGTTPVHIAASAKSLDEPLPTITTSRHLGICEPFLIKYHGNHAGRNDGHHRSHSINEPLPTLDTSNRFALVEPFLVKYNRTGSACDINEPLPTISCRDRFGLVECGQNGACVDIRFRLLQPHELAKAMSFPDHYSFAGSREDKVRQIGNAVPVYLARAIIKQLIQLYTI